MPDMRPDERPRIGISACLLGKKVRYDGGHKQDTFLTGTLGRFVEWVPVCPELELGLGVPRPTLRLEGKPDAPRMVMPSTGEDLTAAMRAFSKRRMQSLEGLDGFVLKKDSPSCGMERVRVYGKGGAPQKAGRGIFAEVLAQTHPLLPLEEEGRLIDPTLRENFIERLYAHQRLRRLLEQTPRAKAADLVAFHARHKLALSARDLTAYRALGQLVAKAGEDRAGFRKALQEYAALFMATLAKPATRKRNADVLFHLMGHVKDALDAGDKEELVAAIHAYRIAQVPLLVPLTLLRHHLRRHPTEWALSQTWLEPWPPELVARTAT